MDQFPSALSLARSLAPTQPVTCLRPSVARRASRYFIRNFPGDILYAVKTNPCPEILDAVYDAGVRRFDVASIAEIELVTQRFPDAVVSFMHPVKNRDDIRRAYAEFGVRDFALDTADELEKILDATGGADDLTLLVRLCVPNFHAALDLSVKFGVTADDAAALLLRTRQHTRRLGVCFHVGSQCMNPSAFGTALRMVHDLILTSGVMLEVVDIGGGFPSIYPNMTPPPLNAYFSEIRRGLETLVVGEGCEIWAEPGRALVAESGSTLVRVEQRRDQRLYINDGTYGSLFDAGTTGFVFPTRAVRPHGRLSSGTAAFVFFGPTCDGMDFMKGPFLLPSDMREGDYIEIGQTGAYGQAMRTRFNGFHSDAMAVLNDPPLLSLYGRSGETRPDQSEFIAEPETGVAR